VALGRRASDKPGDARFMRALESLRHRGPDAQGEFRDERVLLGHTRLSILDLSAAGNQPMHCADGRYVITYNGETYNFRELAGRHALAGLRSVSDTEVVLRLFEKLGVESFVELNGMFAFCIYNRHAGKLWLVRDRLGIKPLYYSLQDERLLFASEMKAILALGAQAPDCDLPALHEWLYFGNALGANTLIRGIRQLLPGHYLELDLDTFTATIGRYWTYPAIPETHGGLHSTEAVIAQTRHLLEQAVRRQLVSDVPVGVFLSGGVDSSAITAFAARAYGGRLATYSAGFDFEHGEGELPRARRVAAHFGTDHHEIHVAGSGAGELVERMVLHHDSPFADPANIPLYLLASQLRGQVKVVLQGDGGDELFGGYRRYRTLSYYALLHWLARAAAPLGGLMPGSPRHARMYRYLRALGAVDLPTTIAMLLTPEDGCADPAEIFAPAVRDEVMTVDPFLRHRHCFGLVRTSDVRNQMCAVDMMVTLPDLYLEKVDRATMAASLEVRVPFLDNDLVDFVVPLAGDRKVPRGRQKWLLKSALEGIVPAEVLHGPKSGLEVPFSRWLRGALRPLFLDELSGFARRFPGVLNIDRVRRLFEQSPVAHAARSHLLWKILNFMIWADRCNVRFAGGSST
jgi:asparagine synthase (glutamine-hydrolysing)